MLISMSADINVAYNVVTTVSVSIVPYVRMSAQPLSLVGWLGSNVPFQQKIGYIGDKVLGGDLVPPG